MCLIVSRKYIISHFCENIKRKFVERRDILFSKLEALLKERGISIPQLAEALDMPNSKFYAWRKQGIIPKTEDIYTIAEHLGVDPKSLM